MQILHHLRNLNREVISHAILFSYLLKIKREEKYFTVRISRDKMINKYKKYR